MSIELIVEVLKHAPAVLNPTERLTLVAIAESCRSESRTTFYRDGWDADELARRVGVTAESLTKVFRSLASKGCEVRVPQAVKNGKPVFAFKGKQTTFKLPRFAPQRLDSRPPFAEGSNAKDRTSVRESLDESPVFEPQSLDESPPLLLKELPSKNTSPPPTPSTPGSAVAVVEAEIVEEEGDVTLSLEDQLQNLTGEILKTRPNWSVTELRTYITAAMSMLGESFEAAAEVARRTAKDPVSARPSRIIASGNPHLRDASTAFLFAKVDHANPIPSFGRPHPNAHPFEADRSGISCRHCGTPVQNGMHKVGNQGGGYVAQCAVPADEKPGFQHWRPPSDQSEYDKPFSGQRPGQPYRDPTDMSVYHNDWQAPRRTT